MDQLAATHLDECIALARDKVPFFSMFAGVQRGCVLAQTGKAADVIEAINAERPTENRSNDIGYGLPVPSGFGLWSASETR